MAKPTERVEPGPGQESVWDYPRPPRLEAAATRAGLRVLLVLAMTVFTIASATAVAENNDLWRGLRSAQYVALLRHALAPGTGDPADFTLDDCTTQRNLSDEGRAQARRIGDRFRANGITAAGVFSSQWCRCLDTAKLLGLGPVEPLPGLNSFFRNYERREPQTQALKDWLAARDGGSPLVLVTHQVNITALTGVYPSSGELVVVEPSDTEDPTAIGTIETD